MKAPDGRANRRAHPARGFDLGRAGIGSGFPCFIVGEVGQAHDGSLGIAHAFIDAIAGADADAVKFQTHLAEFESTPAEPWRVPFSKQDRGRYEYWKRTGFTVEQWLGLREHAEERGLVFLSSPFSLEAADLLQTIGVPAWKVPSGEVGNVALLDRLVETNLPILLSTGMSPLEEIDAAVERVFARGIPLVVMQCASVYPTPPEALGLNLIEFFRQRYGCPVGFSDHSGTPSAGLAAATIGVDVLEVHVTLSRELFGPDVAASLMTEELRSLVQGIRFIEKALANPVDKNAMAADLESVRATFTKSVVLRTNLPEGTVLAAEHLTSKKPGTGIPAGRLPELVGRRLTRPVRADELVREEDLEEL